MLNEQERCRTIQSAHEQQLNAAQHDLDEVKRLASEDVSLVSAAAATKEAALRNEIALLKSDIISMQKQEENGSKSMASALSCAQQLSLDLGKEVEQLMSQLSAAEMESKTKDIALEKSQDVCRMLRSELAASQLELESASRLLQTKEAGVRSAQQSVFDLETEIGGLKNDFHMLGKMLRGQSLSDEQLAQIRPLDESNAQHMEIYHMICMLNDLVVASSRPSHSEMQCIAQAEALAAKLKETESSLTIELEKSWNMAKKMSDLEDERSGFIVAIRDAAAALSSKEGECSVLVSQVEDLKKLQITTRATIEDLNEESSRNAAVFNAERSSQDIQRKNLEISELKIQLSALKMEFDRLSAVSSKSDARPGSDLLDAAFTVPQSSSRTPRNHYDSHDHMDPIREAFAEPSRDSAESLLSQHADTPRSRDFEEVGQEWQLKLDKLRSQNEALAAHVKSLYAEIKTLRLQQCSDAVLVQKLEHMESLNVEIMKRSAESEIVKDSTEHKLEVAQMVIKHLKQCTLELDQELNSLKSNSSSGQVVPLAGNHAVDAVKKESELSSSRASDIEKQLIASQSEVRALSRILSESIATNENKEFDLRLRISQLEDLSATACFRVAQLENALKEAEAASARLNGDIARLEEQLALATSELNAARQQFKDEQAAAAAENARINSKLQSSCETVEALSAQSVAAEKTAAAAQELAAAESLRVAQLENALKEAEAAGARLNSDIARLE